MLKQILAGTAAVAAIALVTPVMAQAPDNEGEIVVNVHVKPFVEIHVIDEVINWDSNGTGEWHNDLSGIGNDPGVHRARFEVRANDNYNLTVTSQTGCWQALDVLPSPWDTYEQVKFEGPGGTYIGGSFYLDRTPASGTITHYWDGDNCNLVTENFGAEIHTWGLSATFAPELYADGANPDGDPTKVAPVATYTSTALITATLQ